MPLRFDHVTLGQRVLFGAGEAVAHAASAVEGLGARRVLLISGGSAAVVADAVAERVPVAARVGRVAQHVPLEDARAAIGLAGAHRADAVIAIGGGSATGLAKAVARDTGLPIVAVPTTFAGSEATDVWGITEAGRKTTGADPRVLPRVVVYDAQLVAGLPAGLAVASGLNAVAHAVDGFWAPRADPIDATLGSGALELLVPGLRRVHADAADLDGLEQTLAGAYLAAVSFAGAGSGMHHKICHVLGGAFGLPHAPMHAVLLPYVLAFNADAAPGAARRVAAALGSEPGVPAASALAAFAREVGAPASLAEIGLAEADLAQAARLAAEAVPASNPRPVGVADVEDLLRAAWAGEGV